MNEETTEAPKNTNESSPKPASSDDEARVEQLARKYRHVGYAIMGGLALAVSVFLLYTAITSINDQTVRDETGHPAYCGGE